MQFEMQPRTGSCAQPQCLQTSPRSLSQCQCRREEFRFHIVHLGADSLIRTKIKGRNRKNWNKVFLLNLVRKPWRTDKSNTFLRVMPPVQLLPQMLPVTSVLPGDRTHAHDICAEKNISDYEAIVGSKAQKRSFVCF